jgi:hypothetical protein
MSDEEEEKEIPEVRNYFNKYLNNYFKEGISIFRFP